MPSTQARWWPGSGDACRHRRDEPESERDARGARAAARQAVGWAQPHKRRVQMRGEHARPRAHRAEAPHADDGGEGACGLLERRRRRAVQREVDRNDVRVREAHPHAADDPAQRAEQVGQPNVEENQRDCASVRRAPLCAAAARCAGERQHRRSDGRRQCEREREVIYPAHRNCKGCWKLPPRRLSCNTCSTKSWRSRLYYTPTNGSSTAPRATPRRPPPRRRGGRRPAAPSPRVRRGGVGFDAEAGEGASATRALSFGGRWTRAAAGAASAAPCARRRCRNRRRRSRTAAHCSAGRSCRCQRGRAGTRWHGGVVAPALFFAACLAMIAAAPSHGQSPPS